MKLPLPSRIPILYLILIVLVAVGVVPLYFYASNVVGLNRDTLERNEKLLQNMVTTNLAEAVGQREKDIRAALANLSYAIQVSSDGTLNGQISESPQSTPLLTK